MAVKNYCTMNGQLIGEYEGTRSTDYILDGLGSVIATFRSTGTIQNQYRYSGYGQLVHKSGTAADPYFLWVGGWGYRTRGMVYVRLRTYYEDAAVWTSIDPVWPDESAYGYALGNPLNFLDATGLDAVPPLSDLPTVRPPLTLVPGGPIRGSLGVGGVIGPIGWGAGAIYVWIKCWHASNDREFEPKDCDRYRANGFSISYGHEVDDYQLVLQFGKCLSEAAQNHGPLKSSGPAKTEPSTKCSGGRHRQQRFLGGNRKWLLSILCCPCWEEKCDGRM